MGEAAVTMTGPTYHITRRRTGFQTTSKPTRLKAETFQHRGVVLTA